MDKKSFFSKGKNQKRDDRNIENKESTNPSNNSAKSQSLRVVVKPNIVKKIKGRVRYIFREAIASVSSNTKQGDVVEIVSVDNVNRPIASGFYNPKSEKSPVTIVSWTGAEITEHYVIDRIKDAILLRRKFFLKGQESFRMVDDVNDFLSGLTIDKFKDIIVIHCCNPGWIRYFDAIVFFLENKYEPRNIYLNIPKDAAAREAMDIKSMCLKGETKIETVIVEENGFKFNLSYKDMDKTGFFFFNRDVREYISGFVMDKEVLMLFPVEGAGVSYFYRGGAKSVTYVCNKKEVLNAEKENTLINSVCDDNLFVDIDPFKFLNDLKEGGKKFDMVVLYDPNFLKQEDVENETKRLKGLLSRIFQSVGTRAYFLDFTPAKFDNINNYKNIMAETASENNKDMQVLKVFGTTPDTVQQLNNGVGLEHSAVLYRILQL